VRIRLNSELIEPHKRLERLTSHFFSLERESLENNLKAAKSASKLLASVQVTTKLLKQSGALLMPMRQK